MSIEGELLQTALGILEDYEWGYGGDHHKSPEASILNDIRKLLAQPEPEQQAEAWIIVNKETGYRTQVSDLTPFLYHREIFEVIPLYTAPPVKPEQEPVTDKPTEAAEAVMPNGVCVSNVYDAYEEGRKSVMSEQEPVSWMVEWVQRYRHNDTPIMDRAVSFTKRDAPAVPNPNYIPLYTAPQRGGE